MFHALDVLDDYEITSFVLMGSVGRHFPSFLIGDIFDVDFGEFDARVEHLPFLPEISYKQSEEA